MARKRMFFSSDKAKRELGYQARPAEEALRDAVTYFRFRKASAAHKPGGQSPVDLNDQRPALQAE